MKLFRWQCSEGFFNRGKFRRIWKKENGYGHLKSVGQFL